MLYLARAKKDSRHHLGERNTEPFSERQNTKVVTVLLSFGKDITVDSELHILQHSLGVGDYGDKPSHRNHFVTGAGCADHLICQALVDKGLMSIRPMNKALTGGDDCFVVTPKGVDYVALNSPSRPKLSKSKERYMRYREYNECFDSFIDFCRWDARPERSWNGG